MQIHEKLVGLGHDIGRVTINNAIAAIRKKLKEVYVRQHYDFGDRLEYDFGEVLLDCGKHDLFTSAGDEWFELSRPLNANPEIKRNESSNCSLIRSF